MAFYGFSRLWLLKPIKINVFFMLLKIMHPSVLLNPIKTNGFLRFFKTMAAKTYKNQWFPLAVQDYAPGVASNTY